MSNTTKYKKFTILLLPIFFVTPIMPSSGAVLGTNTVLVQNTPTSNTETSVNEEDTTNSEIPNATEQFMRQRQNQSPTNTNASESNERNTDKVAEVEARREQIKKNTLDREERIEQMKVEAESRFEERRAEIEEKKAVRKEEMQAKLTEIQEKRLELIKEHAALLEVRVNKVSEFMYTKLKRISKHVEERETEGFDLESFKKEVDAIEDDIAAVEAKAAEISNLYENIEELPIEEMKANFTNLKTLSEEIKNDFSAIRDKMTNLISNIG